MKRGIQSSLYTTPRKPESDLVAEAVGADEVKQVIAEMNREMLEAAEKLEFEKAALLRDQIAHLRSGKAAVAGKKKGKGYKKRFKKSRKY